MQVLAMFRNDRQIGILRLRFEFVYMDKPLMFHHSTRVG